MSPEAKLALVPLNSKQILSRLPNGADNNLVEGPFPPWAPSSQGGRSSWKRKRKSGFAGKGLLLISLANTFFRFPTSSGTMASLTSGTKSFPTSYKIQLLPM